MAKDVAAVKVGTGTLYVAPAGTAFPADPTAAPAVDWEDIGYSDAGWTFFVDRTFEDIEVAEEFDALDVMLTKRMIRLEGVSVQVTLEHFQIAMGGGTITPVVGPPATKKYTFPATSDAQVTRALLLRVDAPTGAGNKRDFRMPKGISVGAIEVPHAKAPAKRTLGMGFRIVKPAAGEIVEIVDVTTA